MAVKKATKEEAPAATPTKTVDTRSPFMFQVPAQSPNPYALDFPPDRHCITQKLRETMQELLRRIHGDKDKLKTFEDNLAVLLGCLYARYSEDYKELHGEEPKR